MKSRFFCGGSALAVTFVLAVGAQSASAQPARPAAASAGQSLEDCLAAAGESDAAVQKCNDLAPTVTEVVSTGSRIRGLPEDAALPVETINRERLQERGNPTMLEMIKTLSEIGNAQGESNRGVSPYGAQSVNLRAMGSGRTLALVNGRRLADSPADSAGTSGNFQNIANVPSAALQQVEILKDGGTTTYGADAVAGVVNFITRRDLNGVEVNTSYTAIKGSAGDTDSSLLWGKNGSKGNILLGVQFESRAELRASSRNQALQEPFMIPNTTTIATSYYQKSSAPGFLINLPGLTNGGAFNAANFAAGTTPLQSQAALLGLPPLNLPGNQLPAPVGAYNEILGFRAINTGASFSSAGATYNQPIFQYAGYNTNNIYPAIGGGPTNLALSGLSGVFRDPGCANLGGIKTFSSSLSPVCFQNRGYTENIVEGQEAWQVFGDANFDVTDNLRYHSEFSFRRQLIDVVQGTAELLTNAPCEPLPGNAPARTSINGAALPAGRDRECFLNQYGMGSIPSASAYDAPGYNPAVADFLTRFGTLDGSARALTNAQLRLATGINSALPTVGAVSGRYTLASAPALDFAGQPVLGGRIVLPTTTWNPFGFGGNPSTPDGLEHSNVDNISFRTTQEMKADFGKIFGVTVDMDLSATFQKDQQITKDRGMLVDRLQRALNGFATNLDDPDGDTCTAAETTGARTYAGGGFASSATIQVPYTVGAGGGAGQATNGYTAGASAGNGCYFLNPFSTAERGNPFQNIVAPAATATAWGAVVGPKLGGTAGDYQGYAPGYGLGNAPGIARWLYESRFYRVGNDSTFLNLTFNGDFGDFSLPGGKPGWAAGGEYRFVRRVVETDRLSDLGVSPCTFRRTTSATNSNADPVQQPGISGSAANDALRNEPTSTCFTAATGVFTDATTPRTAYPRYNTRETHTGAGYVELALPLLKTLTGSVAYRYEEERQNGKGEPGTGVKSYNLKWQALPNLALRASAGDTFDPQVSADPAVTITDGLATTVFGTTAGPGLGGGTLQGQTISVNNDAIAPETGFNYNIGLIWQTADRRLQATLDFFDIKVEGTATAVTATTYLRAATGINVGNIDRDLVLDCNNPVVKELFTTSQPLLGDRPIFAYTTGPGGVVTTGCATGTTSNGAPDGRELSVAFVNQVNAGGTRTQGIDGHLAYNHPDEWMGGRVTVVLDASVNLIRLNDPTTYLGTVITAEDDLLGRTTGLQYTYWRGGLEFNYRRGRHNLSWQTRGVSSLRTNTTANTTGTNYNPDFSKVGLCAAALKPDAVGGHDPSVLGPAGVGEGNYNATCDVTFGIRQKLAATFISDMTYRFVWPTHNASFAFTVNNVFDTPPPFYGVVNGYDQTGAINLQGRNYKFSIQKKFF